MSHCATSLPDNSASTLVQTDTKRVRQKKRRRQSRMAFRLCVFVSLALWVGSVGAFVWGYLQGSGTALEAIPPQWLLQVLIALLLPPIVFIGTVYVLTLAVFVISRRLSSTSRRSVRMDEKRASPAGREGVVARSAVRSLPAQPATSRAPAPTARQFKDVLDHRHIIRAGGLILLAFVVVFFGWAALAPLESAMIAPGVIVVESHRKTIQHLEGGIVRNVLVTEGEKVNAGQPLLELEDTQAKTTVDLLQGETDALLAAEARLTAERDNKDRIVFPAELSARASDPKVVEAMRGEEGTFRSHRETLTKQIAILTSHGQENERTIEGLKAQQSALETQIALIARETGMVEQLVSKGIEPLPRLLALQRQAADLTGQRGQIVEKISQIQVNTGEFELQIVNLRNQFLSDKLKDLRDVQTKRFDFSERIHGAADVLARTVLTTPVGGRVVGLSVHTKGAVIRPGETLLEIVPDQDELEVETHVRPEDINDVHVGMPAKVNLTAYQQRRLPLITGTVTAVSPDRLIDQHTGQPYFNAQVSVDRKSWNDYPEVRLIPGMPAEVALETGSRTMLEYFLIPIEGVLRRGMRER
jgi:HlyD family type I secretion membrane fusion protein